MPRLTGIVVALVAMTALMFAPRATAQSFPFALGGPAAPPALAKQLGQPVSAKLMATLGKASRAGLDLRANPSPAVLLAIAAGPRLGTGHKVGLLYVGADFCPYCAGQRWGLVLTLLRFGKFSDLRYMLSSASDVYANTPTVTFQHAGYQSRLVTFQAVETTDRDQHALMSPSQQQIAILNTFDAPPYVRFAGSIPFVYLDGKYQLGRLLVMPKHLAGMDWQHIADTLADPHSILFRSVMPRVNLLTAAICHLDGGQPAHVCKAPGVVAAQRVLAGLHPTQP